MNRVHGYKVSQLSRHKQATPVLILLVGGHAGSMSGARETVAKAVTLECMRGAVRQQRACFLYAFRSVTCTSLTDTFQDNQSQMVEYAHS